MSYKIYTIISCWHGITTNALLKGEHKTHACMYGNIWNVPTQGWTDDELFAECMAPKVIHQKMFTGAVDIHFTLHLIMHEAIKIAAENETFLFCLPPIKCISCDSTTVMLDL